MIRISFALFCLVSCCTLLLAQTAPSKLTLTGTLKTGIMAPGGESTGITLTTADGKTTYELDIPDEATKKKAETLSGKSVTVTGTLTLKQGIAVGQHRIITVSTLEAAAARL